MIHHQIKTQLMRHLLQLGFCLSSFSIGLPVKSNWVFLWNFMRTSRHLRESSLMSFSLTEKCQKMSLGPTPRQIMQNYLLLRLMRCKPSFVTALLSTNSLIFPAIFSMFRNLTSSTSSSVTDPFPILMKKSSRKKMRSSHPDTPQILIVTISYNLTIFRFSTKTLKLLVCLSRMNTFCEVSSEVGVSLLMENLCNAGQKVRAYLIFVIFSGTPIAWISLRESMFLLRESTGSSCLDSLWADCSSFCRVSKWSKVSARVERVEQLGLPVSLGLLCAQKLERVLPKFFSKRFSTISLLAVTFSRTVPSCLRTRYKFLPRRVALIFFYSRSSSCSSFFLGQEEVLAVVEEDVFADAHVLHKLTQ